MSGIQGQSRKLVVRPKASLTAGLKQINLLQQVVHILQLLQQILIKNNVLRGAVKNAYSSTELTQNRQ